MSITLCAVQYTCDRCDAVAPNAIMASKVITDTPLPPGWSALGRDVNGNQALVLRSDGRAVIHLCSACSVMPAGELLFWLTAATGPVQPLLPRDLGC
jgi:hypothetical protein